MPFRSDVLICMGTSCIENNSFEIRELIREEIKKHNLEEEIRLVSTGCFGFCDAGPIILVQPDGVFYQGVKEKDIPFLVEE
ncbi:(2Fe-2S) ferredoxin domain-containing protein, partial [candidate division WOR-3 bacterium]|nr:(2Fe-2S) ferredoxin domain-containing protein [candidate division WOR-3 bacterium]